MSESPVLRLTDRLRGVYTLAVNDGAGPLNGSDTFTRKFETPPIQKEAAAEIERLNDINADLLEALKALRSLVTEGGVPRYTVTPGAALNSVIEEIVDPALSKAEAGA